MDETPSPKRSAYSLLPAEDVRRIVSGLRLISALIVLALAVLAIAAAAAVVTRLLRPVNGGLGGVVVSGVLAVVALGGGMAALDVAGRQAKKAEAPRAAAAAYRLGCALAGGMNFLAGSATVVVIFANGVSRGLWVPEVLLLGISALGLVLAMPRVRHLRQLYYSPMLPVTRV